MKSFDKPLSTRTESRTIANYSKVQKLVPVMGMLLEPGEGGLISQNISIELDPIPGRLLTPILADMFSVYVPIQACDAILAPTGAYAGMTDVIRDKLLSGTTMFALENEGELTQRMGFNPTSISGAKQLSRYPRLAHNAAVNFLRRRLHKDAVQVAYGNVAVTPALLGSTALARLNAVLDPEDRVNGAVQLSLPTMNLPVTGTATVTRTGTNTPILKRASDGVTFSNAGSDHVLEADGTSGKFNISDVGYQIDPNGTLQANLAGATATLNAVTAGNVSLTDFYNAETMDRLTRAMGQLMDQNPELGQELVLRWAHGLSLDTDQQPFLIAEQHKVFNQNIVAAMDTAGVNAETIRSDMALNFQFQAVIPRTELGGVVITFVQVKPDETLGSQPHPVLGRNFMIRNYAADSLKLDPQPVTMRELNSDVASGDETTIAMYTGLNELVRNYVHYGFGRNVNPALVANKMAIWQLQLPLSVTPSSVLHPSTPDQSIFADTTAEVVRYTCSHQAMIKTPIIFGPTPVETLPIITSSDILDEVP